MIPVLAAVLVSTAISLEGPVAAAAAAFTRADAGEPVTVQAAASGVLLAQIERGAPVDVFVSASPAEIARLAGEGRILAGSRRAIAANRLVVVVRKGLDPPASLDALTGRSFDRIAVGNPRTVPAGRYAAQALATLGLEPALKDRLVTGENVRQVLLWVERGEADAGFVYATDALAAAGEVVAGPEVPPGSHDPILYEGAVISGARGAARGAAFLDFLAGPVGRKTLASYGFDPPPAPR